MKTEDFLSIKPGSPDEDALNSLLYRCRSKAQHKVVNLLFPFARNIEPYWGKVKIDIIVEGKVDQYQCDIIVEFTEYDEMGFKKLPIRLVIEIQGDEHRNRGRYSQDIRKMNALRAKGYEVIWVENLKALRHPAAVVKEIFKRVDSIRQERYRIELDAWESRRPEEPKRLGFPAQLEELIQKQANNGAGQNLKMSIVSANAREDVISF